tara:strand:+ start:37510 stop:38331 length:822 start_codon:yes stop_codon:yes gene_type:complete
MSENKPVFIALIVTGILLVGFLAYYFLSAEPQPDTVTDIVAIPEPATIEVIEPEAPEPEPEVEPEVVAEEPAFVLPRLENSDQLIRDGAVSLTRHEGINTWLGSSELIRKTVAFTDNIANGSIAKEPAAALAPRGQMSVQEISEGVYVMNERSYDRFNNVTNILLSIDTKRSVEFYVLLRPLFAQAYGELGYPSGNFDQVILRGIGRLLETPQIDEPAKLIRPVVMYEYQDPKLEMLSPAQKQLLRMGPKNADAIKAKLRDIARELRATLGQS